MHVKIAPEGDQLGPQGFGQRAGQGGVLGRLGIGLTGHQLVHLLKGRPPAPSTGHRSTKVQPHRGTKYGVGACAVRWRWVNSPVIPRRRAPCPVAGPDSPRLTLRRRPSVGVRRAKEPSGLRHRGRPPRGQPLYVARRLRDSAQESLRARRRRVPQPFRGDVADRDLDLRADQCEWECVDDRGREAQDRAADRARRAMSSRGRSGRTISRPVAASRAWSFSADSRRWAK